MFAIRTWLLLVTSAAVLCGALVLVAPALDQQELAQQTSRRVESAAQAGELLLRLHMQKWVEASSQLALDSVIGDALDEANRDSHELQLLTKSLQGRLRNVRDKSHADLALVLDAKGRLVAESGGEGLKARTVMTEHEAVASALRGTRSDAFWLLGARAYRVAIAPASRERGVVVLGQELSPELLATIRDAIGTDLVLVTPDRVLAAVPAHAQVAELPARVAKPTKPRPENSNAWPAERIGRGAQSMLFAGRWLGDPQKSTMLLCAVAPQASFDSPLGRTEATVTQVVRSLSTDGGLLRLVAIVLGVALVLLIFGQWLVSFDGSRPLRRLVGEAQLVARGDQQRLSAERLPKRFAVLARTLNAAFDRFGQRARGSQAPLQTRRPDAMPPPVAAAPLPPPAASTKVVATSGSFATSAESSTGEGVWAVGPQLGDLFAPQPAAPPLTPRPSQPAMPVATTPPPAAPAEPDDPELRAVYDNFRETRETCGESNEGLTWEKFHARLKATVAVVQKQHNCSEVKYGVYVKDGKAAIKVTPVK